MPSDDNEPKNKGLMTLDELYKSCIKILNTASDTPALDARIIAQNVLNIELNAFILHSQDIVSPTDTQKILELTRRRAQGEPVAYLIGQRGFYEDVFTVNENTLIPRSDTEILVETAIEIGQKMPQEINILDLCCGTGCIGISVAKALAKQGKIVKLTLTDISKKALEVCKINCERILRNIGIKGNVQYTIKHADLFEGVEDVRFDMILTNPPYIASSVIETLEEQVKKEPILALDGGQDGLKIIRKITKQAPKHANNGAYLLMEIGFDQGATVKDLFEQAGLHQVEIKKDLGGRDRVVKGAF